MSLQSFRLWLQPKGLWRRISFIIFFGYFLLSAFFVWNPVQNYCFWTELLWWFSPLLTSVCNYLPNLLRREVEIIPDDLVCIHKRKALFCCQMQEESFDVIVTTCPAFCRAFQEVDYFFFLVFFISLIIVLLNIYTNSEISPCCDTARWTNIGTHFI